MTRLADQKQCGTWRRLPLRRGVTRHTRPAANSQPGAPTARSGSVLVAALGLALAGCGGTTTIGNEAAAPTPTTISTTTTTTLPPTTTTTIDFNRPVSQNDTPLPEDALIEEVAEVVNDVRGQTDDLHQQMVRLVDFPKLASPVGSQILDIDITMTPGEDNILTESTVVFRTPNGPLDLVGYFDAEMISRSWNEADVTTEPTEDGTKTSTVFRWPGASGDDKELTVTVDPRPGLVVVTIGNRSLIELRDDSYDLLKGWQDKIRTPSSAEVIRASLATAENIGTLVVTYELDAETPAEARTDILDAVRSAEFETTSVADENDGSPVTLVDVETGEEFLLEFAATNNDEIIEMVVSATFPLEPLD
ncbi:MAG: hypothetical protein AAGA65_04125 [Actinomycetota bacterium]